MSIDLTSREQMEGFMDGTLDEEGLKQLKQCLQGDPALRASMTMELRLRGLLQAKRYNSCGFGDSTAIANDEFSHQRLENAIMDSIHVRSSVATIPIKPVPKSLPHLTRAAAWLGAFTWLSNKAQAAATSTIIMTKTSTTAITAAILLSGGGTLYLIHQNNERATATSAEHLDLTQLTAKSGISPSSPNANSNPSRTLRKTNKEILLELNKTGQLLKGMGRPSSIEEAEEFAKILNLMDEPKIMELLLEADQMDNLNSYVEITLLDLLSKKSPANATQLTCERLTNATEFDIGMSVILGQFFKAWMKSDPAAADTWYSEAMASGKLYPKSIPKKGMEKFFPERVLAQNRFSSLLETDTEQALAMFDNMVRADALEALNDSGPKQIVDLYAGKNTDDPLTIDMLKNAKTQGNLRAHAASVAFQKGLLSRSEALKIINGMPATPEQEQARNEVKEK